MAQPAPQPTIIAPGVSDVVNLTPAAVTKVSTIQTFSYSGADPLANQEVNVSQFAWSAGAQVQTAGITIGKAWVSAAGVVSMEIYNDWAITGGGATPAAGYYGLIFN